MQAVGIEHGIASAIDEDATQITLRLAFNNMRMSSIEHQYAQVLSDFCEDEKALALQEREIDETEQLLGVKRNLMQFFEVKKPSKKKKRVTFLLP